MNKIKNTRSFILLSFSAALTTILFNTITLAQIIYSEEQIADNNFGKFFKTPGLSIQQANSGLISQINSTSYLLELKDVSDKTVSFVDRPNRNVTSITTEHFVEVWDTLMGAEERYGKVPPNAALTFDDVKDKQEIFVKLYNPVYNKDSKILNYDFKVIDNSTFNELPLDFGQSSLLIGGILAGWHPSTGNVYKSDC